MKSNPGKTVSPTLIERLLYVIGIYAFFFMAYGIANRVIPLSRCRDLSTALDYAIPFVPGFIFFFCFSYVLMLIPALIINDRIMLRRSCPGCAFRPAGDGKMEEETGDHLAGFLFLEQLVSKNPQCNSHGSHEYKFGGLFPESTP